jgi:hypothetical protein
MFLSAIFSLIGTAAVLFLLRFLLALAADGKSVRKRQTASSLRIYNYLDWNSTPSGTFFHPGSLPASTGASDSFGSVR